MKQKAQLLPLLKSYRKARQQRLFLLIFGCIAIQVAGFPLLSPKHAPVLSVSSTQLFGFRTKAKEKISSLKYKLKLERRCPPSLPTLVDYDPDSERNMGRASQENSSLLDPLQIDIAPKNLRSDICPPSLREIPSSAAPIPFIQLPTIDDSHDTPITKVEEEFRNKISHFGRYSQRDVALFKSFRLRVVMDGMAASALEPAVYRAFEILYQDLTPLRLAGRLIFKRLSYVVGMCVQARTDEIEFLLQHTELSQSALEAAQYDFLLLIETTASSTSVDAGGINDDREHDAILSMSQLKESGAVQALMKRFKLENGKQVMSTLDPNDTGELDFPQFILGLQQLCTQASCDDPSIVSQELLAKVMDSIATMSSTDHHARRTTARVLDPQRQIYSNRYDDMLDDFAGWEDRIPATDTGRRLDILRGCFVGARNGPIREALRVAYVDHGVMRVVGNTIFSLMSALIPTAIIV